MRYSRPMCVAFMCVVLAGVAPDGSQAQAGVKPPMPPNLFATTKLNDHLYVIAPSGPDMSNVGGNIGVCISDQGVLLVDANYSLDWRNGQAVPMAQAVVDEVKKLTSQPIRWVINTHHHGDHAGGDPVFAKIAMIVSHKNAREHLLSGYENAATNAPAAVTRAEQELAAARKTSDAARIAQAEDQLGRARMNLKMAQSTDPQRSLPTLVYDGELALFLSSEEVRLYHFGRAHTDGDTLVYFKTSNVIHWGDTFSNRWIPAMDLSGNSLDWVRWLDRGLALSPTATMVPGHGAIGTQADVMKLRTFFTNLQAAVRQEIAAGKTREQAMDDVKVPEYASYPGGTARLRTNVGIIYDQLKTRP
jgi:glyoxylase-like metal-dependent hydrolase (beta-lactamase superfamily II)